VLEPLLISALLSLHASFLLRSVSRCVAALDYIAPEICALLDLKNVPKEDRPQYGTKCDIWSAGVM